MKASTRSRLGMAVFLVSRFLVLSHARQRDMREAGLAEAVRAVAIISCRGLGAVEVLNQIKAAVRERGRERGGIKPRQERFAGGSHALFQLPKRFRLRLKQARIEVGKYQFA